MAYINLRAEQARKGISSKTIALSLGISEKSYWNKINNKSDFSWSQTKFIHKTFFSEIDKEYLFQSDNDLSLKNQPSHVGA